MRETTWREYAGEIQTATATSATQSSTFASSAGSMRAPGSVPRRLACLDGIADGRRCFTEGDTIALEDPDRHW
jgi:hypothetical protein